MIAKSRLRTVGVVLAGGVGQRVGLNTPKQLLKIAGRTILEHTLEVFEGHPEIDDILVLMAPGFVGEASALVEKNRYTKVTKIIEGGVSRTESTWRALQALGGEECDVLLHDAVRPLIDPRIVSDCVAALSRYEAVNVAIPSSDTIVVATSGPGGEIIRDALDRSHLRRCQTPQCFRLSVIRAAYERAFADPDFASLPATDDCGVVLRYLPDVPIYMVPGSERNMKVTHPIDIFIADKLLQFGARTPPGVGEEACRAALAGKTLVVFDGGHGVGAEISADIVDIAKGYGAAVRSFSRAQGGIRIEDAAAVEEALAAVYAETGRIDFVVNTTNVMRVGKLAEAGHAATDEAIGVNYIGPVNIARASIKYLARTRGHLLLSTSAPSTREGAGEGDSLSSSTTAAVVHLAQTLADEWAEQGVRVNCVNPERTAPPTGLRPLGDEPEGSPLSPAAVARTSVDVLASGLTGQVVDVDPLT